MGIAATPSSSISSYQTKAATAATATQVSTLINYSNQVLKPSPAAVVNYSPSNSMSENYHHHQQQQGIFVTFPTNGYERTTTDHGGEDNNHHQIRRDNSNNKLFEPLPNSVLLHPASSVDPTAAAGGAGSGLSPAVYETAAGMLSEMFNFGIGGSGNEMLQHQMQQQQAASQGFRGGGDRGLGNLIGGLDHQQEDHQHQITVAHESAAAMQLFLTHPHHAQQRSPSPPPRPPNSSSAHHHHNHNQPLHLLLPNQSIDNSFHHHMNQNPSSHSQFSWDDHEGGGGHHDDGERRILIGESQGHHSQVAGRGQGLSLSLSTSLQHLDPTNLKVEQMRMGGGAGDDGSAAGMMFFGGNDHHEASTSSNSTSFKDFGLVHHQQQQQSDHQYMMNPHHHHHHLQSTSLMGHPAHHNHNQLHLGFTSSSPPPSSIAAVNVLRHSKYTRAARELLEEFCSVGRGILKKSKSIGGRNNNNSSNDDGGSPSSSATAKETQPPRPLSPADRMEHQRRKVKLLSMLDEVERRYTQYCEQMQMVVNSFDLVMGFGAATPYTALAQKAMSRHFRCLKDGIHAQLKHSCELLGEKDYLTGGASGGLTKGETPRLKMLEQSLRQQRAFHHQMGLMDNQVEAWRPQRGLPERSVNILRAWLFEHFLHPYPSDADKLLLARQTGLSRNQVSNWFINARVRLWKPMVEDMYQQEAKEREKEQEAEEDEGERRESGGGESSRETAPGNNEDIDNIIAQTSTLMGGAATTAAAHEETDGSNNLFLPSVVSNNASAAAHHHYSTFSEENRLRQQLTGEAEFVVAGQVDTCDDYGTTTTTSNNSTSVTVVVGQEQQLQRQLQRGGGGGGGVRRRNAAAATAAAHGHHHYHQERAGSNINGGGGGHLISFGTTAGDVSLTLGLHHGAVGGGSDGGDKNSIAFDFSRDFGGS